MEMEKSGFVEPIHDEGYTKWFWHVYERFTKKILIKLTTTQITQNKPYIMNCSVYQHGYFKNK